MLPPKFHACRADSLTSLNVLNDDRTTVLSTGVRQQYGGQLSGGTDRMQYFVSGEWEDELGNYKMPKIEIEPASKSVVWTFDQYDQFGNSVSNSQLLDIDGDVIR